MNRCTFAVLATMLTVLTVASSAMAECAWVTWQFAPSSANDKQAWTAIGAFSRESGGEAACDRFASDRNAREEKNEQGKLLRIRYTCLPDTVDPRGPKGGTR